MVLEATMVCLDNSEWMRNGDYPPSRLDAQQDAVNLLCQAKLGQNRESSVGILTMAGKSARILVTQTNEDHQILKGLHLVKVDGECDFIAAIRKAQLALKHRQNQAQRQRIVMFIGSPLNVDEPVLKKVGKDLKKNGVAVDLVSFGEEEENSRKLEEFYQAVNSSDNSHLVTIPTGPHILSDFVLLSPIVSEDGGAGEPMAESMDGSGFPDGVDPNVDPELAMALRISMEEERERQAILRAAAASETGAADAEATATTGTATTFPTNGTAEGTEGTTNVTDEDLYGSGEPKMQIDTPAQEAAAEESWPGEVVNLDELDEDARFAIEVALAMEQAEKSQDEKKPGEGDDKDTKEKE